MSVYTKFVSGCLFPLHEKFKGHRSVAVRKSLEETQWWSRERLQALQLEKLRTLLSNVGLHVPYFRDLFRAIGFNPQKITSLRDIQLLPFMTKPVIRAQLESLKSEHAQGLARFNTGGSSGEPLIFFIGKERVSHDVAAKWRATRWWSVDIGDPELVVWGSPIELGRQDRVKQIRDGILRTSLLPAFEMSEAKIDGFIEQIRQQRPKMLFGYPSALSLIAARAQSRDCRMDDLGIRVAFVTSERLYEAQRETIQQVFGCPVANGYGGRDAGFIAHECPAGGMHMTAEDVLVEIVDTEGRVLPPGESGEIVVTHFATRDFPFIRYRTGDVGVMDETICSCGRGLPLLKEIQGRTTDFVMAKDGTKMHGLALIYVLRDLPGIDAFKIIQESRDHTRILLVPGGAFEDETKQKIIVGFKQRLGQNVSIDIEMTERIDPERSGKFRYIVSHAV